MKFLFLANPTVGHTNYLIELASSFMKKEEEVLFVLPGIKNENIKNLVNNPALKIDDKLKERKIPYYIIPMSLIQGFRGMMLDKKSGLNEILYALKVFSSGLNGYVRFLLKLCEQYKPDVIIYDYTFFPAIAVSEKLSIKRVAVYHSGLPFLEYPIPPIGTDLKYGEYTYDVFCKYIDLVDKEEKKIGKRLYKYTGQKKIALLDRPNSNFLNVINTVVGAEYPRKDLPSSVHFVGPITRGDIHRRIDHATKKIIYISLGTVFNNRPELFERIIRSIDSKEKIVVAAGKSYETLIKNKWGSNVEIFKYVNQTEVLESSKLFITHGGKNSISESIVCETPMILFPAGGEQEYNANLVEWLGVGINFSKRKAIFTYNEMNASITRLCNNIDIVSKLKKLNSNEKSKSSDDHVYELITEYKRAD